MKLFLTKTLLLISIYSHAQAPWRAKLFVHFLDSSNNIVTDTVWFGCDSLGAEGFQPGLDVIDTNLQWNKVYSADEIIKSQFNTDCANLKTNIREFNVKGVNPIMKFQFYTSGKPVSMSWDTTDFIYKIDSTYRISGIFITAQNGYIYGIDARQYILGGDSYKKINNEYIYTGFGFSSVDSIQIFPETFVQGCRENMAFSFEVEINLGWWQFTNIDKFYLTNHLIIYPNPFIDRLYIESDIKMGIKYSILSSQGIEHLSGKITSDKQEIDMSLLRPGIYFIQFYDNNSFISKPYKIIKQ